MNKKIGLIALTILITGCTGMTGNTVKNGDSVSITYIGTFSDGTVFDSSNSSNPLTFTIGNGEMISGFENALIGMSVGEEKTFTLNPSEAYGERSNELIAEVNKSLITDQIGEELEAGMMLYSESGIVTVLEVGEENVTLDLNHPLAGRELTFRVMILSVN